MTPLLTPTMTGLATPDPLRFAFTAKTSAHVKQLAARLHLKPSEEAKYKKSLI